MPRFFNGIIFGHRRSQNTEQQHASRKWFKKCFGRSRRSSPSSKYNPNNVEKSSNKGSTPSTTLSETPPTLMSFQEILERVQQTNRRQSQRRAVQMDTKAHPQPLDTTHSGWAGERRDCARLSSMTVIAPMPFHSVDEEFDKELVELNRLRWDCLAHLCSIHGKEKDPYGYVTLQSHGGYRMMLNKYNFILDPVTSYRLVKIDTLPLSEQNLHYETALSRAASVAEVRVMYEKHLCRLERLRKETGAREEAYRGMRRLGNRSYDVWFRTDGAGPEGATPIEDKAEMAFRAGKRAYEVRLWDAVAERGIMRLLERCERMLKQADPIFVPIVWMRGVGRRWKEAIPGWTGLELQDSSCNAAIGENDIATEP